MHDLRMSTRGWSFFSLMNQTCPTTMRWRRDARARHGRGHWVESSPPAGVWERKPQWSFPKWLTTQYHLEIILTTFVSWMQRKRPSLWWVGRLCGRVVRLFVTGVGGPGFKTQLVLGIFQKLPVHPAVNGYLALFRAGEGERRWGRGVSPSEVWAQVLNQLFVIGMSSWKGLCLKFSSYSLSHSALMLRSYSTMHIDMAKQWRKVLMSWTSKQKTMITRSIYN